MNDARNQVINFEALYKALNQCANGVRWKNSTIRYLQNGLSNTEKLREELESETYKIGKQIRFRIYEPKKREVVALRFKDRQVQRALLDNYLYEEVTQHFIYDNVACQRGKGTKAAVKRLKVMLEKAYREYGECYYIHLFDIRQFFGSTKHDVAKAAIQKRVRDKWTVQMVDKLIDSFLGDVGIGLGSDIAQFIELSVLDDMDHFIKEKLHERYYLRYMDDFLIISNNKERLKADRAEMEERLETIGLMLHPKKTSITTNKRGFKWQGFWFRQKPGGKIIMTLDKKKIIHERRKLKRMVKSSKAGKMPRKAVDASIKSWEAHAKIGNDYSIIQKMKRFYEDLLRDENV